MTNVIQNGRGAHPRLGDFRDYQGECHPRTMYPMTKERI